ncbi:MAG: ATP-binding protein [Nitrospirae bacterium]|nr:ATP-binding protein [Nitrospirota bacterium]
MIKKEILKEVIRDFHKGTQPESRKRDLTIPLNTGKVITLSGVRRSGKTYMLFETMKLLLSAGICKEKMLYINFEDERLDFKQNELDMILQAYREMYPDIPMSECCIFFDEIQNVEGWEKFVRRMYDTVSKNIFVTGSNSRLLSREIATSLRGRTLTCEVFPLSFMEYLRFHDAGIDLYHSKSRSKIANLFERFLFEGGFPEIIVFKDASLKNKVLQEYFDVMLYRDMVERFGITNIPVLKYFLKRVFENITSPLSVNNIYNELKSQGYKTGKNFLYEYLDAAEAIYLFRTVNKQSESVLKRELSEKKVYAVDNGLLNAVTFKFSRDYGKLLENSVFMELHKSGNLVFFYKSKRECDFIVMEKSGIKSVIQVAYSIADSGTRKREIEGLVEACRRFSVKSGYVITFSEEETLNEQGVTVNVMPAYKFFLAL